jgi:glutathione S-transferase
MHNLIIANRRYSSWSLRAWLAARKSGISFETVALPLGTPDYIKNVKQYAPFGTGRLPILQLGEAVVWDSLAIAETLAETCPSLLPNDFPRRTWVRSICAEMHSGFSALRQAMPMNCCVKRPEVFERLKHNANVLTDIERIQFIWQKSLESSQKNGETAGWLMGQFTLADAFFAPEVSRFNSYGVPMEGLVKQYAEHVLADSDMQAWYQMTAQETNILDKYENP